MDVKEAVATAKAYVADLFAEENVTDLGLEEVSLDDHTDQWVVTLGFARPWDRAAMGFLAAMQQASSLRRSYKVVRISDKTREVVSLKNRDGSV
jgi:hypothetical protein